MSPHRILIVTNGPDAGVLVELHETTHLARQLDGLLADHRALAARRLAESQYSRELEVSRWRAAVESTLVFQP